jgi:ferrous iron transport protein A
MKIVTPNQIPEGHRAVITSIAGDKGLTRKMISLGLRVGAEISVVQLRRRGVVLAIQGGRIALGERMADSLCVKLVSGNC